jgi:hypothetical protein
MGKNAVGQKLNLIRHSEFAARANETVRSQAEVAVRLRLG